VEAPAAQGLRPADDPIRWTETTATYRTFDVAVEEEAEEFTLDFDIAKLGRIATALVAASLIAAPTVNRWQVVIDAFVGHPA
jgi:hypothetical protein